MRGWAALLAVVAAFVAGRAAGEHNAAERAALQGTPVVYVAP